MKISICFGGLLSRAMDRFFSHRPERYKDTMPVPVYEKVFSPAEEGFISETCENLFNVCLMTIL